MKIVQPQTGVLGPCPLDFEKGLEWIERAGRVCYKSEDKITPGSARSFISRIIAPDPPHLSVTEHSNMVFVTVTPPDNPAKYEEYLRGLIPSKYLFTHIENGLVYFYGNYRAFYEELKKRDPDFSFFDLENLDGFAIEGVKEGSRLLKRVTDLNKVPDICKAFSVIFRTDRAVSHEIVRHRPCAFSQESQRYVRYDGGMEFIEPYWFNSAEPDLKKAFLKSLEQAEKTYIFLRKNGVSPQAARLCLPNSTASTIVVTAYLEEWMHIFNLRVSSAAFPPIHKQMEEAQKGVLSYLEESSC